MPIQARTEFAAAINQIASEKGVETEIIIDAIKMAALAAYRKDLSYRNEPIPDDIEELVAKLDPSTGEISIFRGESNITPPGFARIAAQTAKQVITQKLHEAEKGAIIEEYDKKVGTLISGSIQRQEGSMYFVDLGRAEGILPPSEQTRDEYYAPNQRMKFFIKEIRETSRGPEVVVSRTDPGLVKGLFALEVPEIQSEVVEIKEIAREPGGRTKVAVVSHQDGVDPVGSMVGQKGVRVQAVINELGEEKVDIIMHSDDPARFIASALSPAKDVVVNLNEAEKVAKVKVSENQLSLAIGKGGQNVRLAAKLTGWKIDIEGLEGPKVEEVSVKAIGSEVFDREAQTESAQARRGEGESDKVEVEAKKTEEKQEEVKEAGTSENKEQPQADQPADVVAQASDDSGQAPTDDSQPADSRPQSSSVGPPAPLNDDAGGDVAKKVEADVPPDEVNTPIEEPPIVEEEAPVEEPKSKEPEVKEPENSEPAVVETMAGKPEKKAE